MDTNELLNHFDPHRGRKLICPTKKVGYNQHVASPNLFTWSNDITFELKEVNTNDYEISEMKMMISRGRGKGKKLMSAAGQGSIYTPRSDVGVVYSDVSDELSSTTTRSFRCYGTRCPRSTTHNG